jgi:cell division protein FtsI/penicillin-binding protein 2
VAQRLGDGSSINNKARTTMYTYLHDKFRLGQLTGIEVSGESPGDIVPPTDADGNAVRYSNMSFGQGMDLTMVQVAAGFSTIVNGGTYNAPTVLAGSMSDDGTFQKAAAKASQPNIIKSTTSDQMRQMVVTARKTVSKGVDRAGYTVGGKTGTSQTLINGSYDNDQTVASYLGFGGDTKPRYVIMVQVSGKNQNQSGGTNAMPIFTDISNWMIDYLKLQPKA